MKKILLSIVFIFAVSPLCFSNTIQVPGDQPSIQAGIDAATAGDIVLVAPGTYVENLDFNGKAIHVKSEEGSEFTTIDGSDPVNPECGSAVTFHHGEGNDSKLQGFALINGTGTYHSLPSDYEVYCGGGIFCDHASPTVIDCLIKDNSSQFGGGMYNGNHSSPIVSQCSFEFNYSTKGGGMMNDDCSSPSVSDCMFKKNMANREGGGIYNRGCSSPVISECMFERNILESTLSYGGAISNDNMCDAVITDCEFSLNQSGQNGGAIQIQESSPLIEGCDFYSSKSEWGGAIFISYNCDPCTIKNSTFDYNKGLRGAGIVSFSALTLEHCRFCDNTAEWDGGGVLAHFRLVMKHCTFKRNEAGASGGGVSGYVSSIYPSYLEATDCLFGGNIGENGGGIIFDDNGYSSFTRCVFRNNEARGSGGGAYSYNQASPILKECIFQGNSAEESGGGMFNNNLNELKIIDCLFADNNAMTGGGMYNYEIGIQTIDNCTFTNNSALDCGGGIYFNANRAYAQQMRNTILWGDSPDEIVYVDQGKPQVACCNVEGGYDGLGNIDKDPLFVDAEKGDFHLTWLSPCINRGMEIESNSKATRECMGSIDIGAYEFIHDHALGAETFTLPESGGAIQFHLNARRSQAGEKYILLGGITGTVPGYTLPGGNRTLPVNIDSYTFSYLLPLLNTALYQDFMGTLSPMGQATAVLDSGPLPPRLAGTRLHFAYCLGWPWDFASNPVEIVIVP